MRQICSDVIGWYAHQHSAKANAQRHCSLAMDKAAQQLSGCTAIQRQIVWPSKNDTSQNVCLAVYVRRWRRCESERGGLKVKVRARLYFDSDPNNT